MTIRSLDSTNTYGMHGFPFSLQGILGNNDTVHERINAETTRTLHKIDHLMDTLKNHYKQMICSMETCLCEKK